MAETESANHLLRVNSSDEMKVSFFEFEHVDPVTVEVVNFAVVQTGRERSMTRFTLSQLR